MTSTDLTLRAHGTTIAARHWAGAADRPLAGTAVVMAHGFGGTVDSGLADFAEPLARAGCDVVAFDYRGWGASGDAPDAPRQQVSLQRQRDDYRAVLEHARGLPGVTRVVLWGVSLSGGHVLSVAAGRDDVAAVVSLTPLVDGAAAGRLALQHHTARHLARSTALGVRSRVAGRLGRTPSRMPIVARPGELGALTLPGAYEDYTALAGPTWRNEVDAAVGLELGAVKVGKDAADVRCPVLVQIADADRSAPPHAAATVAFAARAQVRHYPCDHFDVWRIGAGTRPWHDAAVAHQIAFLERVLAPAPVA